jgi:hypothetical protein
VGTIAFWHVAVLTKENLLRELFWVFYKNIAVFSGGKIIKIVVVEDGIFCIMTTVNKFLVYFPAYRAHVAILTQ